LIVHAPTTDSNVCCSFVATATVTVTSDALVDDVPADAIHDDDDVALVQL
jgi:hypothetical protein